MPAMVQALTNAALMERARHALERRLAADPRDEGAFGLGDVARREGKFAQAVAAYRALHALRGDAASAWAMGAIGGEEPLGAPPGRRPRGRLPWRCAVGEGRCVFRGAWRERRRRADATVRAGRFHSLGRRGGNWGAA